jgi:ubiquinone/menaquinone biosynthesis C-methylase UbiE
LGAVKLLKKFFAFFKDPKNQLALMYIEDQDRFLQSIGQWTEVDMELYKYLSESAAEALRDEAVETLNVIAEIPFLRDVHVADYKNAFE